MMWKREIKLFESLIIIHPETKNKVIYALSIDDIYNLTIFSGTEFVHLFIIFQKVTYMQNSIEKMRSHLPFF